MWVAVFLVCATMSLLLRELEKEGGGSVFPLFVSHHICKMRDKMSYLLKKPVLENFNVPEKNYPSSLCAGI